jgi:hypothetical protein
MFIHHIVNSGNQSNEVIAKPLGAQAFCLQIPEKCGHYARDPAKPEGFALCLSTT